MDIGIIPRAELSLAEELGLARALEEVAGKSTYADGESFPDDCNTCTCRDGDVSCTEIDCGVTCVHNGSYHGVGDTFPAGDGCNTCSCAETGDVACTRLSCGSCAEASESYQEAFFEAKACDPFADEQCSLLFTEGLACRCPVFVNPEHAEAIAVVQAAQTQYEQLACGGDVACGRGKTTLVIEFPFPPLVGLSPPCVSGVPPSTQPA